jgi:hypothetical protein
MSYFRRDNRDLQSWVDRPSARRALLLIRRCALEGENAAIHQAVVAETGLPALWAGFNVFGRQRDPRAALTT